jgi:hypothetical protein
VAAAQSDKMYRIETRIATLPRLSGEAASIVPGEVLIAKSDMKQSPLRARFRKGMASFRHG